MATVTKNIGTGGDYATVAAWSADLNNGAVYTAGDTAVANIVTSGLTCNLSFPATILPTTVRVQPDASIRHRGQVGSGCRLVSAANSAVLSAFQRSYHVEIFDLEIDYNGFSPSSTYAVGITQSAQGGGMHCRNLLIYGFGVGGGSYVYGMEASGYGGGTIKFENCAVIGLLRSSTFSSCIGIYFATTGTLSNCVVAKVTDVSTATAYCYSVISNCTVKNCVGVLGKTACFTGTPNASSSNNASSDGTAPGANSITSLVYYDHFRGLLGGDPHLLSGSSLIGAGIAISGLTEDIDGDTYDSPPAIGCDEYVATGGGSSTYSPFRSRAFAGGRR